MKAGGNCVDAAIAMAAAINMTEPTGTGIGGDCFCLYYDAEKGTVEGMNASGRAPVCVVARRVLVLYTAELSIVMCCRNCVFIRLR